AELQRLDHPLWPHALAHPETALDRHERRGMVRAEPVELGSVLPPQVEEVLEALGADERCARALAFEERVRGDRRPVSESLDLQRTLLSPGVVELPPRRLDEDGPTLELTLAVNGKARTIEIGPGRRGYARVTALGRAPSARTADGLVARVRHVLALDEDLSD